MCAENITYTIHGNTFDINTCNLMLSLMVFSHILKSSYFYVFISVKYAPSSSVIATLPKHKIISQSNYNRRRVCVKLENNLTDTIFNRISLIVAYMTILTTYVKINYTLHTRDFVP